MSLCEHPPLRLSHGAFQPYAMSSTRDHNQSRVSQEALLTPVCDTGHSEVLRGRLLGTQPFEKGLGFSQQQGELHSWDHDRRKVRGRHV